MDEPERLRFILFGIAKKLSPLNSSYTIDPNKVWFVWIMGKKKGLSIAAGSPDPADTPDGYELTITRHRGWRFWKRDESTTSHYRIDASKFLSELKNLAKDPTAGVAQYYDNKDPNAPPSLATIDLSAIATA